MEDNGVVLLVTDVECTATEDGINEIVATLSEAEFHVVSREKKVLTPFQAQNLFEDTNRFLNGAVEVLEVAHASGDPFNAFVMLGLHQVFATDSMLKTRRARDVLFPEDPVLERALVIFKPDTETSDVVVAGVKTALERQAFLVVAETNACVLTEEQSGVTLSGVPAVARPHLIGKPIHAMWIEKVGAHQTLREIQLIERVAQGDGLSYPSAHEDRDLIRKTLFISADVDGAMAAAEIVFVDKLPLKGERTFAMIKPDSAENQASVDAILKAIDNAGFTVLTKQRIKLSVERAEEFYAEHAKRPFFGELAEFMSSGSVVALVLAKPCAIKSWRKLIGPTNTAQAREEAPKSLRGRFGTDGTRNAVHGSDSPASARREIRFFFPRLACDDVPDASEIRSVLRLPPKTPGHSKNSTAEKTFSEVLVEGLTALAKAKPAAGLAAITYLGEWLLNNNPNKPIVEHPADTPRVVTVVQKLRDINNGKKLTVVFVVGPPGSGKHSQAEKVAEMFDFTHIAARDYQKQQKAKTETSECGEENVYDKANNADGGSNDAGLVSWLAEQMVAAGSRRFILSGFPATMNQAVCFEEQICPCTAVLDLSMIDTGAKQRAVQASRSADGARRLKLFNTEGRTVIDHYHRFSKVRSIAAEDDLASASEDAVFSRVKHALFTP